MDQGQKSETINTFCTNVSVDTWNSSCTPCRRDIVALRTTCTKIVKFKISKIRTGFQFVGYLHYSKNPNWAAQNLRLGRGLDIADLKYINIFQFLVAFVMNSDLWTNKVENLQHPCFVSRNSWRKRYNYLIHEAIEFIFSSKFSNNDIKVFY